MCLLGSLPTWQIVLIASLSAGFVLIVIAMMLMWKYCGKKYVQIFEDGVLYTLQESAVATMLYLVVVVQECKTIAMLTVQSNSIWRFLKTVFYEQLAAE